MRTVPFAVLFALCALCGVSGGDDDDTAPPVEDPDDIGAVELAAIRAQLDCTGAVEADYCAAIDRFGNGQPAALPPTATARLGRCLFTRTHRETAAHMVAGPDGLVTGEVTPDNPEEQAQIDAIVATLRAGQTVPPSDPVLGFVRNLPTTMARERTRIEGRSRVYGQRDRWFFRQTGGGEVIIVSTTTDGPLRIAVFR